jgi:copper resistance protein B
MNTFTPSRASIASRGMIALASLVLFSTTVRAQDHADRQTTPAPAAPAPPTAVDHAAMGHAMPSQDEPAEPIDHAAMGHAMPPVPDQPREPIRPLTDADRAAAFPELTAHAAHGNSIVSFIQFNRLETWDADPGTGLSWEGQGWIGNDMDKLRLRSEGERVGGDTEASDVELLYSRAIARWWDVVAGVRHDFDPGSSQSWAALGVIGLAPQKFEVEATAFVGESGRTAARFEIEYELLLTNRLILQPLLELNLFGKDDPQRGIGSGLSTAEAGLRLRYEFTRRFAPYIGLVHERAVGNTADLRRAEGDDVEDTRLVAGVRLWF